MARPVKISRIVAVVAAATALLATSAVTGAASAQRTTADVAYVRAAHLSPDTPKVDVYLTSFSGGSTRVWLSGVGYGDVSVYRRMPAGQYAISMRPHGAPASSTAALSWTITLKPQTSYTAAAIGKQAQLHGIVVRDTLASAKAGTGYLRVVQASSLAPSVSVVAGGTTIASDAVFGSVTKYVSVPAGKVALRASSLTDPSLVGSVRLTVPSRSITSVVLLDKQGGGIEARPLLDAAAPKDAAKGSVPAGGGGTAASPVDEGGWSTIGTAVGIGALALLLATVVSFSVRRRRA